MVVKDLLFYARIKRIEFENFRNIERGTIEFPNSKPIDFLDGKPSVVGLYGQNGSGKTSVIMALGILKDALSGKSLSSNYLSCVRYGCESSRLTFTFAMYSKLIDDTGVHLNQKENTACYDVYYEMEIAKEIEDSDEPELYNTQRQEVLKIVNEVLKYRTTGFNGKVSFPKQTVFNTKERNERKKSFIFGSELKERIFTGFDDAVAQQYRDILTVTTAKSQSFVFARKTINLLEQVVSSIFDDDDFDGYSAIVESSDSFSELLEQFAKNMNSDQELREMLQTLVYLYTPYYLIKNLRTFGTNYLHVIDTVTTGQTNINTQMPLLLWWHNPQQGVYNYRVSLQMNGPTQIPEKLYGFVKKALNAVSDVLETIVPGVRLSFVDLGIKLSNNNEETHCFEILSKRGEVNIPLKYESDGIRRIVSILSLLIAAYNDESFTIAIDEIDSGIYEYLLGELLSIMGESIKGQLIFTSHNLRPLEVLPSKFLCFTTINPENRFVRITARGNSNLRDTYFRSIVLNNREDGVYNATDKYLIELAIYKAGHYGEQHE